MNKTIGFISAVIFIIPLISLNNDSAISEGTMDSQLSDKPSVPVNNMTDKSKTFIINVNMSDLNDFSEIVQAAKPLKKYGNVQINIGTLAEKSFYEIPPGGNPWNEYSSYNATLVKFFPDPEIAPFIPGDVVQNNRKLLVAKARMLRNNNIDAAFFANEPAFLPSLFFEKYPHLRGPRVDHPRRSRVACFSPCLSTQEMQDMYINMTAEMLKTAPEIKTFYFKTNDAGSGNCWSDWLYSGPNGPAHCKDESTGERIAKLLHSIRAGAEKTGNSLDVYLSHPQGSSNFSDTERDDIQKNLPPNCYFKSTPEHEIVYLGSEIGSLYPVKGICDILSCMDDLNKIKIQKSQTIFLNFGSYYGRGNESIEAIKTILSLLTEHFAKNGEGSEPSSKMLLKFCSDCTSGKDVDILYQALEDLHSTFNVRHAEFGNLAGIYWNVSSRMINRPLIAVPQRLSKQEESYFLPYVFNVSVEEARMDYLDIHGGRWTLPVDTLRKYVNEIGQICCKLDSLDPRKIKNDFIRTLGTALRVHASLVRSCANFTSAQNIRDRNAVKLNGPVHRPDKESTWKGDIDLLNFNAVMRDELDNTSELTKILENGGMEVLCIAKDTIHEDCFLLGPEIINQLKEKYRIMINHWRDIEDYMTTPFK